MACLWANPAIRRACGKRGDQLSVHSRSLAVGLQFGNINANQARSAPALMGWFGTLACRTVHFIWLVGFGRVSQQLRLDECPFAEFHPSG